MHLPSSLPNIYRHQLRSSSKIAIMSCTCSIVPPHLLEGIAASEHNPQHVRDSARATLEHHHQLAALRKEHLERYPRSHTGPSPSSHDGGFIPKHLLDHLAASEAVRPADDVPVPAQTPAEVSSQESKVLVTPTDVTDQPEAAASVPVGTTLSPGSSTIQQPSTASVPQALYPANASPISRVYDAQNATDKAKLPGALISIPPSADRAALEAYTNITTVLAAYRSLFNWKSLDNQDATVTGSVHYGIGIQNAYWDRTQLLFGDGGTLLYNFTNCLDVIGHELQHAVTQNTCGLAYEGQSGALNEHLSDVFGIIFLQYKGSIKAREAKWLIGEGCLMPKVDGVALRSMKDPGTAYKDDRLVRILRRPSHCLCRR